MSLRSSSIFVPLAGGAAFDAITKGYLVLRGSRGGNGAPAPINLCMPTGQKQYGTEVNKAVDN
jgi:hypothetical protein